MGRIDMVIKTTDENEKLRRRIQELEDALRPFADLLPITNSEKWYDLKSHVDVEDVEHAAEVLGKTVERETS